jgi:hypothetical protein
MGGETPDELLRRDLSSGQTTTWLYRPGESLYVAAVSGGRLLVYGYAPGGGGSQADYLILSGPNEATALTIPGTGEPLPVSASMVADKQGIWLGSDSGIYLWTQRTGPVLVSDIPASPAGTCA